MSLLALAGIAPTLLFVLLWVAYLSLTIAGQTFLSFQWDVLLLEAGLLACLYAPLGWWPRLSGGPPPSSVMRWAIWLLAFKVTFLSGVTKLVSGDATWRGLTALTFHYETQPIPAWTSWFAHQLPVGVHMASVLAMFAIELAVPFGALAPAHFRRVRAAACVLMGLLQVSIAFTGNYGFFSLLTIVLYLALLDDQHLRSAAGPFGRSTSISTGTPEPRGWRVLVLTVGAAILFISTLTIWHEMTYTRPRPRWSARIVQLVQPTHSINGYGLFRTMTTERPEIVVLGSHDGVEWSEYAFRWKPGALDRRPGFVQPHMPRLDWLMWFAAPRPVVAPALAVVARRPSARRNAGGPRPVRGGAVSRRPAPIRATGALPLPLHGDQRGPADPLVAPRVPELPHRATFTPQPGAKLACLPPPVSKSKMRVRCPVEK